MPESKSSAKRHKLEAQITKLLQDYEKDFPENRVLSIQVCRQPEFQGKVSTLTGIYIYQDIYV